jgi:hypothetical protein
MFLEKGYISKAPWPRRNWEIHSLEGAISRAMVLEIISPLEN